MTKIVDNDSFGVYDAGTVENSDWPVRLLVRVTHTGEYDRGWSEAVGPCHVAVQAVARDALPDGYLDGVKQFQGLPAAEWDALPGMHKDACVAEYGAAPVLWQAGGHDEEGLVAAAAEEVKKIRFLFGFYMDRRQNAVGATGWDVIKGRLWPSKDEETEE